MIRDYGNGVMVDGDNITIPTIRKGDVSCRLGDFCLCEDSLDPEEDEGWWFVSTKAGMLFVYDDVAESVSKALEEYYEDSLP